MLKHFDSVTEGIGSVQVGNHALLEASVLFTTAGY
jgi:hypothetical protein